MRGIPVFVFRGALGDCTNGGISAKASQLLMVGVTVDGFIDPAQSDLPVVHLVHGNLPGTAKLVPADTGGRWTMFGGNYAASSDDRFTKAVERITGSRFYGALPIHDRIEG